MKFDLAEILLKVAHHKPHMKFFPSGKECL